MVGSADDEDWDDEDGDDEDGDEDEEGDVEDWEADQGSDDDERIPCPDGTCIGIIGSNGLCCECGAKGR